MRQVPAEEAPRLVTQAQEIRCVKCRALLGEDYDWMVLVKHHGRIMRYYGPGVVLLDCPNPRCKATNVVELGEKAER